MFCAGCAALPALALSGCASTPDPGPQTEASEAQGTPAGENDAEGTDAEQSDSEAGAAQPTTNDRFCKLDATVTVRVDNQSSMNIQLKFGPFQMARPAMGFSRTSYQVPRAYLHEAVQLRIQSGGMQIGVPPPVATEPVFCNIATLVIGSRPSYSIFYGDALPGDDDWPDARGREGREGSDKAPDKGAPEEGADDGTDQEGVVPVP